MSKKIIISIILSILIATGLYLNFILQKDFLVELGFVGTFAVLSVLFFDIGKVFAEILFFKLRMSSSKIVVGMSAIILIVISVYTTFAVRTWKSVKNNAIVESVNKNAIDTTKRINRQRDRLDKELVSVEKQIDTKMNMIEGADPISGKWLIFRYNKEMSKLNNQKVAFLNEIIQLEKQTPKDIKKKVSMTGALILRLGSNGKLLDTYTNLIIAITVDGLILLFNFGLGYIWKEEKVIVEKSKPKIVTKNYVKPTIDYKIDGETLKSIRKRLDKSQEQMATDLGVNRRKLSRLETGQGKVDQYITERLATLNML